MMGVQREPTRLMKKRRVVCVSASRVRSSVRSMIRASQPFITRELTHPFTERLFGNERKMEESVTRAK